MHYVLKSCCTVRTAVVRHSSLAGGRLFHVVGYICEPFRFLFIIWIMMATIFLLLSMLTEHWYLYVQMSIGPACLFQHVVVHFNASSLG